METHSDHPKKHLFKDSSYQSVNLKLSGPKKSNKLSYYSLGLIKTLSYTFLQALFTPAFLWFVFIISIEFAPQTSSLSIKFTITLPMFLIITARVFKLFQAFKRQIIATKKKNTQSIEVFVKSRFKALNSNKIREGDLLLLKPYETVPCDCLIFAIKTPNTHIYIQKTDSDSQNELETKKPLKETQEFIFNNLSICDLKKHVESVEVLRREFCSDCFSGKVKIKESPTAIIAKNENFLEVGNFLLDCEWVLCMAVYVGKECRKWNGCEVAAQKFKSDFEQVLNNLFIFCIFIMAFFSLLTVLLCKSEFLAYNRENITGFVLETIILYSNLFSITLYLALEMLELFSSTKLNWFSSEILIHNSKSLSKLYSIEYILAEKSGVLTSSTLVVQSCECFLNKFQFSYHQVSNKSFPNTPKNSESQELNFSNRSPEIPIQTFEDLKQEMNCLELLQEKLIFGAALGICNKFVAETVLQCVSPADSCLINFSKFLGFDVSCKSRKSFTIVFNSIIYPFTVLATCHKGNSASVKFLIKDETSSICFLVFKDKIQKGIQLLTDPTQVQAVHEVFSSTNYKGLQKVVFLYKIIDSGKTESFLNKYREAKRFAVNKIQMIDAVFDTYCVEMELLSIIGYENEVKFEDIQCVKSLKDAGIQVWITTNGCEESVLASGYQLEMVPCTADVIKIEKFASASEAMKEVKKILLAKVFTEDSQTDQRQKYEIKDSEYRIRALESLNYSISLSAHPLLLDLGYKQESFIDLQGMTIATSQLYTCIHGETLNLAFHSRSLMEGLMILMFSSKAVFFCNMLAEDKSRLVEVLQKNFSFKPSVMSVGFSAGAQKMLAKADVGVKISDFNTFEYFSDISIKNFARIGDLILNSGKFYYYDVQRVVYLTVFKEFCFVVVLFLYQQLCGFSGTPVVDFDVIVVFEVFLGLWFVLMVACQDRFCGDGAAQCQLKEKKNFYIGVICRIVLASMHGVLIFLFVSLGFEAVSNSFGFTEDFGVVGLTCFVLVNLALYIQTFFEKISIKSKVICFSIGLGLLSIVSLCICSSNFGGGLVTSIIYTSNITVWAILCILPLIFYSLSCAFYSFTEIFTKTCQVSRFEAYNGQLEKLFCDCLECHCELVQKNISLDKRKIKFIDPNLEKKFQAVSYKRIKNHLKVYLIIYLTAVVISNILNSSGQSGYANLGKIAYLIIGIVIVLTIAIFFIGINLVYYYSVLFYTIVIGLTLHNIISKTSVSPATSILPRFAIYLFAFGLDLNVEWRNSMLQSCIVYIVSIYSVISEIDSFDERALPSHITHWVIIMFFFTALIHVAGYGNDVRRRNEFMALQKISLQVQKSFKILSYLLPEFVRKRVKDGVRYIAEDQGTVSIIFCDIYDFDKILEIYKANELTSLLNEVFGRIDLLCETCGVTKIETVGKTYMACAGLKDSEVGMDDKVLRASHARRAVEMALAIIKESEKIVLKDGRKICFKIGVNSGSVIAGVVGYHKPQFSLVGDTVNTASRMASTLSEVDAVQISEETYNMIGNFGALF